MKEEAPHPPRLVGQRVNDLGTCLDSSCVGGVYVVDLNRDVRDDGSGLIVGHQADLVTRSMRIGQSHDPAVVHNRLEAKDVAVKALGFLERLAGKVRNHPLDAHTRQPFCYCGVGKPAARGPSA